jgi:hypothetical protein
MNAMIVAGSVYWIDLLPDNVAECVDRLFEIINSQYTQYFNSHCSEEFRQSVRFILRKNIVLGNALDLKKVDGTDTPIIFSHWSPVNTSQIKRIDYFMWWLVDHFSDQTVSNSQTNLFSDLDGKPAKIAEGKQFPLTHYLKIYTYAN